MKEMVKVTVIATGFDPSAKREAFAQESFRPPLKTPAPFPPQTETPPYLFEPKGSEVLWARPAWEKQWEPYETPSFIRRSKLVPLKKTPDEIS